MRVVSLKKKIDISASSTNSKSLSMNLKRPPLPRSTSSPIHCFSTTTASSSIDGFLFRHVTFVTHLNLSDDSSDSSQTLLVTITTVSNPETTLSEPRNHL
ncbi:hypothetical protein TSUD_150900 [Trifolium subterraneum]|uniref:Uncharacterized protein n=1 Tax=Trifolium subterraneum TaxID=3900 RepID=A0A2Z6LZN1_TRISU|nr:hypothetical protein TSUD_150900 [Trifolium subterraneum]